MQGRGQCGRIVAIGGSVLRDPVKVRVPAKRSRTAVQTSGDRDCIDIGEDRVHGESWWGVLAEHGHILLR
jgi:hypothetical protein